MDTESSTTNEPYRFRLTLADKHNLKDLNKNMALVNLSIYYAWKNIKSAYNNNKFKNFWSNLEQWIWFAWWIIFISDNRDYFEYIIKKHEDIADNPPVQIYTNKIKNKIVFQIKTGYKLELLPPGTMNLLGRTKKDVDQDKDREDLPKLKSVEGVLVLCNLVNNNYQQSSKVLFTEQNKYRIFIHCSMVYWSK